MSASPARFTFDLDMGNRPERNNSVSETALAALLEEARREARQQGIAEGERSAASKAAKGLTAAAEGLAAKVAAMAASIDDTRKQMTAESVQLSLSIARKLAGGLLSREPAAEIEALLAECLSTLNGVPHLVIRCAPELADKVRDIATAKIATSGFAGRLVVMGEPEIAIGDARLEWADGGIVRDIREISADIDRKIADYFAARGIETPPEETEP